ncbi:CPBP family intramembrane glutamic endopeptidase [Acidicapsa dinghuensis]|uniref:CPBP family intramembrane glutamic endopeptidase n=1 Tax=Acidicapsa dinghuensis TaxID=2218256 RepID=A0ABW1EHQ7_9BACT|nr:type II CAAX endopeptidase family protein [Acidicapsa dinghuensis]
MPTSNVGSVTRKTIGLFVCLAYGIAWFLWLPVVLGPKGLHLTRFDASIPVFVSLGTTGPMLASFIAIRMEKGRWAMPSRFFPSIRTRSWLNLFTGPALITIAFVIIPYTICVAPGHKVITLSFLAPLLGVWPNILGGPLEEEFGWRGYLLPRVGARTGNVVAAILVGVAWATWHLPLMLIHLYSVSFWYFLALEVAAAIFASFAYFATGRSILGPVIVHYFYNTCTFMLYTALAGHPLNPSRDVDKIVLLSMIGVAAMTIAVTRGRLGAAPVTKQDLS